MDVQTEARKSTTRVNAPFSGTLDDLLLLDGDALGRLYADARVPKLGDLDGDLRGRMLAIPKLPAALVGAVRTLASHDRFPWRGKSFQPHGSERGEGINRIFTDSLRRYRFETFIGPSRAGAFDALQLDYDNPGNPFFIRPIKDEVRELRPGLWLGQAWLQLRGEPRLVLYFGLAKGG
jgi:hypothetical protein